ncbi:unnamed protein product [Triticum turgidum subsp. durum]|uniref:Uncharacterized protein n=1 Tax=Triticum turgidum subsp. durum TaxID=4567 RepID=A0A9R0RPH4_TRITD|nr:unnamed protein product [Triticum turgidum subsp. durum]
MQQLAYQYAAKGACLALVARRGHTLPCRQQGSLHLIGLDINLSSLYSLVCRCITLMPMKGEILVDTMEKTLKPGVFLKSGLIETEGPHEAVKGHL